MEQYLEIRDETGTRVRVILRWPGAEFVRAVYQHPDGRLLMVDVEGYLVDQRGNRFRPGAVTI